MLNVCLYHPIVVLVSVLIVFNIQCTIYAYNIKRLFSQSSQLLSNTSMVYPPSTCSFIYTTYLIKFDDAQYQRDFRYPAWIQWMFAHVPFLMRWYRNYIMARVGIFTELIIARSDLLKSQI
jgi:hypothetical protein